MKKAHPSCDKGCHTSQKHAEHEGHNSHSEQEKHSRASSSSSVGHSSHHGQHATVERRFTPLACTLPPFTQDERVFFSPHTSPSGSSLFPLEAMIPCGPLAPLAVGSLLELNNMPLLQITGRFTMPQAGLFHATSCFTALAKANHAGGPCQLLPVQRGISLASITLSDKGSLGLRTDESGPRIQEICTAALPITYAQGFLIPDNPHQLQALVVDLALYQGYDLIITTGGTGVGPRDTTPEALLPILTHQLHGFEQAMMLASLAKTPHAAISRAIAGTVGQSLLLTLPGSVKAVRENLESVLPAITHALAKLQGDPADCAAAI